MSDMDLGLQLMAYGLAGVFTVLVLFYLGIKLLVKLFPYKEEEK
ncbi:MAG: OadG family protein [Clostridiales bacterium]|nr:OadG family protein [Clostridiales bacterium]